MVKWYTTVCYFGTNIKNINIVSNNEWFFFVNKYIKPCFNSFTISNNIGYWNGVKELTYTLTIIHKNDPIVMDKLINISKKYSMIYKQDEIIINTTKSINLIELSKLIKS